MCQVLIGQFTKMFPGGKIVIHERKKYNVVFMCEISLNKIAFSLMNLPVVCVLLLIGAI